MHKWEVCKSADHNWADCQTTVLVEVVSLFYLQSLFYFSLEIVVLVVQN